MTEFGWRARIGLILPADNTVLEPELYSLRLARISFHTARLSTTDHREMREQATAAASAFVEMGTDVAVYACAETSFDAGAHDREQLTTLVEKVCGCPVVTATAALLDAIATLGLQRVGVVTPYNAQSGALFEKTLGAQGLEVTGARHRDFREGSEDPREWYATNRQPLSTAYQMARQADTHSADGIVVSSTNLPLLPLHEQLESDLGKPVVSSNQSIMWWCLRTLGIREHVPGYGRLLRSDL